MTVNKDLFVKDPTASTIPNEGVSQVIRPETDKQWQVLEWELKSFVCEGEYERGLERILDSYLGSLGQKKQPAAWVSGFYGSGKSHLCRVLEYLWRDVSLPSGQGARDLVTLPPALKAQLRELSTQSKRNGGLWSAAGSLSTGLGVNLAFLSVLFRASDLPEQYPFASFVLWAEREGYAEAVRAAVADAGRDFNDHIADLYVSPIIAKALLEADPTLGDSVKDVRQLLRDQFPPSPDDLSLEETLRVTEQVLRRASDTEGAYPLALIVLDEMQQFLGDDNQRTLDVQDLVEAVSAGFDNTVLFVTTGQSAMGGTPTLQKLTDRFPLQVALSDKDVEAVVRQVILRKRADKQGELESTLDGVSGEISRHLGGTSIAPRSADRDDLVRDYPLLPTRRRFWELALRALDRAGKAGVLRTQLRIVHEATRRVADERIGHVIGADFLYDQQSASLQQSGALLKEISESILELRTEGPDGVLKSRIAALVFLITNIPSQMIGQGEVGLKANATYIADLLVEDLVDGAAEVRKLVPELLDQLVSAGTLMDVGGEYRIQTEEGAEWERDYRARLKAIRDDAGRLATLRNERLYTAVDEALGGIRLTQGQSKTPRKVVPHYDTDAPSTDDATIPVWIRDEWTVTASAVKSAAAEAGTDSAVVHVLLPKRNVDSLRDALASHSAATETISTKPNPATDEGREARQAMANRVSADAERLGRLFDEVVAEATVLQGGGTEVEGITLRDAVEAAARNALVRLFQKFDVADHASWGTVINRARDGDPDALAALGHSGSPAAHRVVKEVLDTVSAAGTKGADVADRFKRPPYGWEQDVVNGSLLVLMAAGNLRAELNGKPLTGPKELQPRQIVSATFYEEDTPPSTSQRLAVRGLAATADIPCTANQEAAAIPALLQKMLDTAANAGGPAPLPAPPDTSHVVALQGLVGNEQVKAVAEQHELLTDSYTAWRHAAAQRELRQRAWHRVQDLLRHAESLDVAAEVAPQIDAIREQRLLLQEPDPVIPLKDRLLTELRQAVEAADEQLRAHHAQIIGELEQTDEYDALDDVKWRSIVEQVGLASPPAIDIASDEALTAVLDERPLRTWADRVVVLRENATRARELAAKELEPDAARVKPPAATLKTTSDVDHYLASLRGSLVAHIDAGRTVIV